MEIVFGAKDDAHAESIRASVIQKSWPYMTRPVGQVTRLPMDDPYPDIEIEEAMETEDLEVDVELPATPNEILDDIQDIMLGFSGSGEIQDKKITDLERTVENLETEIYRINQAFETLAKYDGIIHSSTIRDALSLMPGCSW